MNISNMKNCGYNLTIKTIGVVGDIHGQKIQINRAT